jgi:hypothetical protein
MRPALTSRFETRREENEMQYSQEEFDEMVRICTERAVARTRGAAERIAAVQNASVEAIMAQFEAVRVSK